jgi:hypothetical protein
MQRPKRACTERAKQKIQEILNWESCTESSQMFKDVENQMNLELESEKHGAEYAPSSTSESDSEIASDDQCSECETDKKEESFNADEE